MILEARIGSNWLTRRTYRRELPDSWEGVPQSRLLFLLRLAFLCEPDQARRAALDDLLQLPAPALRSMDPMDRVRLEDALGWMKVDTNDKPILPHFDHQGVRYFAPATGFANGVCCEYAWADEFYGKFAAKQDEQALLMLTATLWREGKKDEEDVVRSGDRRVKLTSRPEINHRAQILQKLPQEYQMTTALYFGGVKARVDKMYGEWLFQKPKATTEGEAQQPKPGKESMFGWWGIFFDVADNLTNLPVVHQTNFHTLCMYLVKRRKEQRDLEHQMKLNSPDWGKNT